MLGNIKPLIVVLAIAAIVFYFVKPLALQFMSSENFERRRLVWLALTASCFLVPNIWLYSIVAIPLLIWAGRHDSNPTALYLLMLNVIPPVTVTIPLPGTSGLLPLDNILMLSVCVLLPSMTRYRKLHRNDQKNAIGTVELLLIGFGVLQTFLYTPPDIPWLPPLQDTLLNLPRRASLFYLETYLLYVTVARTCDSRQKMAEAAASFCLACGLLAAIAVFENLRGWLLYTEIASQWGNSSSAAFYLVRDNSVRAQVSAGHSISLGNILAIGFGCWLYIKTHVKNPTLRIGTTLLLCGGLYATSSRGAWLGTAIIYFTFLAAGPNAASRLVKGILAAGASLGLVLVTPAGDRIIRMLPESGKPADEYRHHLSERGWQLVFSHPFFGDHFPWPEMADLRQGEGIIDIVNTYLAVGLNYGLVGLFCFAGFILLALKKLYSRARELMDTDRDLALLAASLVASIVGLLVMIDTNSFGYSYARLFYVLAGLATAFLSVARPKEKGSDRVVAVEN